MPNDYSTAGSRLLLLVLMVFAARALAQESPQAVKPDADGVQRVRLLGGSTPHNLVIRAPEAGLSVEEDLGTEPK